MRILVVDDEPMVRNVIRRGLALDGYAVTAVACGAAALEEHQSESFPVALVDVYLGDATGPMLAVRLSAIAPLEVILMSGHPERGAWDGPMLFKPFDLLELRQTVNRYARRT